jgi:hypothetical protein
MRLVTWVSHAEGNGVRVSNLTSNKSLASSCVGIMPAADAALNISSACNTEPKEVSLAKGEEHE